MPSAPFGPPYRIVTPTVVLRCFEPGDAPAVQRLIAENLDHLRPWVGWADDEPKTLGEKLREIRGWRAAFDLDQSWHWAVVAADDGELAGAIVMNPLSDPAAVDTGGWVGHTRARRGFQTDATAAVVRAAFELMGITRVEAATAPANDRSNALMRKLGFTHEATTRHLADGHRHDEMLWSILADEWPATFAAEVASEARAFDALGNRMF